MAKYPLSTEQIEALRWNALSSETRRDLLSNLLVIVVPSDSKLVIASPEELITKSQKIAVADPRAVLSFRSELISALQL
jgi:ABC-type molybdate transport system substrate-binding protein